MKYLCLFLYNSPVAQPLIQGANTTPRFKTDRGGCGVNKNQEDRSSVQGLIDNKCTLLFK